MNPSNQLSVIAGSRCIAITLLLQLHLMVQVSTKREDKMDEVEKRIREQIIQDIESVRHKVDDEFTRGLNTGLNWAIDVINGNF